MTQNVEIIQVETASMVSNEGLTYMYQVIVNKQMTPAISLEGLRELRRLCDCFIRFGEDVSRPAPPTVLSGSPAE